MLKILGLSLLLWMPSNALAQETIKFYQLDYQNDLYYKINSDTPFTGEAVDYYNYDYSERIKAKINFKDGKLHGTKTSWYNNEQKSEEANYVDNELHGPYTRWYTYGQKWEKINY